MSVRRIWVIVSSEKRSAIYQAETLACILSVVFLFVDREDKIIFWQQSTAVCEVNFKSELFGFNN